MSPEDFHTRVLQTIHKWQMFPTGARIGVAVSGGADSVALFRALHALSPERQWTLNVLHVNHKLRGAESDEDACFVQALAQELGSFCKIADLPVATDGNIEQKARRLRNDWFALCVRDVSPDSPQLGSVALGHTRSDQAETVLFRFLRGSGAAGLAGIRPVLQLAVENASLVRPLFDVTRIDTRAYLRQINQPWREDSSNQSLSFARNRIRLELLPLLAREWNPGIENTLAQMAEWARAEEEYWDGIVADLARKHLQTNGLCTIASTSAFADLPTAAARRLIRCAIVRVKGNLQSIDFLHVEQLRSLILQSEGSGRLQIPGVDVMRSFDWVRFAAPGSYAGVRHSSISVSVPGEFTLPAVNSTLSLQVEDADYRYNDDVNRLDAQRISGALQLRTWQPGDQYCPSGHTAEMKLKSLFQAARVPLWDRQSWPVLAQDQKTSDDIVWSRQFGVACKYAPGPDCRRVITISEWHQDKLMTVSPKLESGTRRPTSIS